MPVLLKRLVVLILVPVGLVLLFVPFNTHRRGVWDEELMEYTEAEVPGMAVGLRVAGGFLVAAGLLLMLRLYSRKRGIMIASPGVAVLWDVIVIAVSLFFFFGLVDLVLIKLFRTVPTMDEDFVHFFGVFWVVVGNTIMALFTSNASSQALRISDEGITSDGLFSEQFMPWSEIEAMRVDVLTGVKEAGGIVAPKEIMRQLKIEGTNGTITVAEPAFKKTKKLIVNEFLEHAPTEIHDTIRGGTSGW